MLTRTLQTSLFLCSKNHFKPFPKGIVDPDNFPRLFNMDGFSSCRHYFQAFTSSSAEKCWLEWILLYFCLKIYKFALVVKKIKGFGVLRMLSIKKAQKIIHLSYLSYNQSYIVKDCVGWWHQSDEFLTFLFILRTSNQNLHLILSKTNESLTSNQLKGYDLSILLSC